MVKDVCSRPNSGEDAMATSRSPSRSGPQLRLV